ncbi:DUF192 domain-containing protein [Sphingomonas sp. NFR15]|uniref:DUF192 domain-containing protein n=1 Tax=Sphingomonas sp. NFR15 TaxID=1566282 RepID=UPI0021094A01|nr:DUF192 domain-containing protein [Sphingomonas sp. NFR15]
MTSWPRMIAGLLVAAGLPLASCARGDPAADGAAPAKVKVTISGAGGRHVFTVEQAKTAAAQEQGLMFRTDIPADGGMLFYPYPPDGAAPRTATFWMKNTPSPLDIVFIRADGTIARIAEQSPPFSQAPIPSGEPVAAVLELRGGRSLDLDISAGDTVRWNGGPDGVTKR